MTTSTPLDLTTHHPAHRAEALTRYADYQDATGNSDSARLARLAADTERLLADPDAEPATVDDPAWDEDAWWTLASTSDRARRADLLERLWRDWALPQFGDAADTLLEIARSERVTHALQALPPLDDPLHDGASASYDTDPGLALAAALDDAFEVDDDPADPPTRADRYQADTATLDAHPSAPSTRARDALAVVARWGGKAAVVIVALAAVAVVALPATPWQLKTVAASTLLVAVLLWLARMVKGQGR